jgi:hypothetical protein
MPDTPTFDPDAFLSDTSSTAARMRQAWPNRPLSDAQLGFAPRRQAGLGNAGLPAGYAVDRDFQDAPWAAKPSGGASGLPPGYVVDQGTVWPGKLEYDPAEYVRYKASLPDAPWVGANKPGMFDDLIPAKHDPFGIQSSTRQWAKEVTAPPPRRPQGYGETLAAFDEEARQQLRRGVSELGESTDPAKRTLTSPFRTAGALADIAGGAYHGAIAPATAAFRSYVSEPLERFSYAHLPVGVRAENIEQATSTVLGGAGARTAAGRRLPCHDCRLRRRFWQPGQRRNAVLR